MYSNFYLLLNQHLIYGFYLRNMDLWAVWVVEQNDLILDDMNQMKFPAISGHSIITSAFYSLVNEEQIN